MSFVKSLIGLHRVITDLLKQAQLNIMYDDLTIVQYYRKLGAQIGGNCRIDVRTKWYNANLISIGNHVFIAQGVLLHTHDGGDWILKQEIPDIRIVGKIVIGNNCLIGAYSHILPNVRIGDNSIVGVGSVVISDVPPNSIVMGVPARVIGSTVKYKEKRLAEWQEIITKAKQSPSESSKDQKITGSSL